MPTGLGVDLHAYYQRGVNALPNVEYGWLKLADGTRPYSFKDATGRVWTPDAHAALFRRLGIPVGGYVYAQPGDGAAEADVLWSECQRLGATGVAPACDIESNLQIHTWSVAEAVDHGRAFCSRMLAKGVRPAIYMNDSLAGATDVESWPENPVLWIARYGAKPVKTRYDVHQYRSDGTLPGSSGLVDWNQDYTNAQLITEDDMFSDPDRAILQRLGSLFPDIDAAAIAKRNGHNAGSLTNAIHSSWEQLFWTTQPALSGLAAALAEASKNPEITLDAVRQIVTDAVAQNIKITGTIEVTGANPPAAQ